MTPGFSPTGVRYLSLPTPRAATPSSTIGVVQNIRITRDGLLGDEKDSPLVIRLSHANGRKEYGGVVVGTAACPPLVEHRLGERWNAISWDILRTDAAYDAILIATQ